MSGFTDIHCHLLWGLDDGARSADETLAMLRCAAEQGIARIVATPHAAPGVERFDLERYGDRLEEARRRCAEAGLGIELYGGAEILYTEQTCRLLSEGRVPTLAGTEYVLVEFSPDVRYARLYAGLAELRRWGYLPVLAHAERCDCLRRRPSRLDALRSELELRFQINCASALHPRGPLARRMIARMLARGLADFIATDAHGACPPRCPNLRAAWEALARSCGEDRARALADGHLLFGGEDE